MIEKKLIAQSGRRTYIIEPNLPEVGVYLWIYEEGRDIADYLQNTAQDCIDFAFEEYGVPKESWEEGSPIAVMLLTGDQLEK